ncbi:IQ motif, EF-hand binding site [Corchorus capsularis]|uniref:IQ motif, EF-hand binding site n=1 Tax=Corchorus capsularis TaxID=210143 RepID=A0A1R3JJH9_COCAP|nr:IQ motif, EF-hand binding site [Corchorus capsularis]
MDFPFYGNAWNASSRPFYGQSFRKAPVEVQPKVRTPPPPPPPPPQVMKPKVVSIPVRFVGSERSRPDSSHSAVKIQKVFRGFLVRKSMKKIKAVRGEVNDIGRRVSNRETVDLIRNDSKERLKVNEMLMSLLFKLDSVRGIDSGVRDCRKSVIKKVIALQELVDAIVSGDQSLDSNNADRVAENGTADQNQAINSSSDDCNQIHTPEQQTHDEITNDAGLTMPNLSESQVIPQNQETVESSKEMIDNEGDEESDTDSSANPENIAVEEEESETSQADEEKEESNNNSNKEDKELVRKMMEDNEKMMGLMADLVDKNEKQTLLLSDLCQRVERLEKAFLCEILRRNKRRNAVDCVQKCGKR